MARVPQVTRTIQTTKVSVLCMDIENETPIKKDVVLPRTYKDDSHVLKSVKKMLDGDKLIAVRVLSTEVEEKLYGMSEQKFVELADELPPRKAGETGEAGETDENETDANTKE